MQKIKSGCYRGYFKFPFISFGIKFVKPSYYHKSGGTLYPIFLGGMIMNILEYRRYQYYCANKIKLKWGKSGYFTRKEWCKYNGWDIKFPKLCPTYFTFFGLFNIVKHVKVFNDEEEHKKENFISKIENELRNKFGYLNDHDLRWDNIGWYKNDHCLIDYGDFRLGGYNQLNLRMLDYC